MSRSNNQMVVVGLAAAASVSMLFYFYSQQQKQLEKESSASEKTVGSETAATSSTEAPKSRSVKAEAAAPVIASSAAAAAASSAASSAAAAAAADSGTSASGSTTPPRSKMDAPESKANANDKTPKVKNTISKSDEKNLHAQIEELDKKGKALFKNKQYLEAAQAFTEALDLIDGMDSSAEGSTSSLARQAITLMNNRSAMYEKGGMPELALEDCVLILDKEIGHTKARTRKLRILEALKRWPEALVEVCAVQLLFMQANRTNLRMNLPVPPPPVPQTKMEEILMEIIPGAEEKYITAMSSTKSRPLPSSYTILQLLKSYSEYTEWMAVAKADGPVDKIASELVAATDATSSAYRATVLTKRGRCYAYDREYELASQDFEEAYALVESSPKVQKAMQANDHARLLEWTGMVRHWHYDLDSAMECYKKCAELEPKNALLLVKQAGVQMDAGKHEEALKFFEAALAIHDNFGDALLHRSNLRMLQSKPQLAKRDLQKLLETTPNHVMARLRLASILAATNDPDGAQKELDLAEKAEPNSSEVQSYKGELHFTQNAMEDARKQFEKAMELEPTNPTPYVNAAMALLNTPPPQGQMPDAAGVIRLLERAIEVDPQFTAAYIQLGQLKLGTATDLAAAGDVVKLYDQGLKNCRSPEEVKELVSMRTLAEAQVDAASMLKMETFNMQ